MILPGTFLLCLLSIGPMFTDVAEGKSTARLLTVSRPEMEATSLIDWQAVVTDVKKASDLASQLGDQKNVKKDDKPSDDWICQDLSNDLQQSWNLTVRVSERTVAVVWNMGGVLYDLINCQGSLLVPVPVTCIYKNLIRLKDVVNPAIVEAYGFIKEGYPLVRETITDTRNCYKF